MNSKWFRSLTLIVLFLGVAAFKQGSGSEPAYDIVIANGQVIDGSGKSGFFADIGVRDGKIVKIGKIDPALGKKIIDAKGMDVAPGFIDLHTHTDIPILKYRLAESRVYQGVTFDVIGERETVAPLEGKVLAEYQKAAKVSYGIDVDWTTFTGYFDRLQKNGLSINLASGVSPQQIRKIVVNSEDRPATAEELEKMKSFVSQAMEQGAFGLTSAYTAGGYKYENEMIAMAQVAARYGGYYGTHMGGEGDEVMKEVDKAILISEVTKIPVHIYHLKVRGQHNFGKVNEVIQKIEAARARGLDISANQYPYTAMEHPWHRLFPDWVQQMSRADAIAGLAEKDFREKIKADPLFAEYISEHGGWGGIVGTLYKSDKYKGLEGKSVLEIAQQMGQPDPAEMLFDIIVAEKNFPPGVHHSMSEPDVQYAMKFPWVSIASDGYAMDSAIEGKPHPRSFGTNARVLGRYVRELKILSLEDAIRKMTSLPAQTLGLKDRGLLKEGHWADIVVFDPEKISDPATYAEPKQYAKGVSHVLVNGTPVINEGVHTGATPGRVVYGPGRK